MRRLAAALVASVVWIGPGQAFAETGTGQGCDGAEEKGVTVPCAGYDFCLCAMQCSNDSDCMSNCCSNGLCVPDCVCRGESSYNLCDVGAVPAGEPETESGGCSTAASPVGGIDAALLLFGAWFGFARRGRGGRKGCSRENA